MRRATWAHRREVAAAAGLVLLIFLVTACTAGPNSAAGQGPSDAGFWLGLWQGFIAPIAFLVSLFNHSVGVYEVHNNGGWYNFGFLVGVSIFFRQRRRRRWPVEVSKAVPLMARVTGSIVLDRPVEEVFDASPTRPTSPDTTPR